MTKLIDFIKEFQHLLHKILVCNSYIMSATSHSNVQYIESLWIIRHYVMRPSITIQGMQLYIGSHQNSCLKWVLMKDCRVFLRVGHHRCVLQLAEHIWNFMYILLLPKHTQPTIIWQFWRTWGWFSITISKFFKTIFEKKEEEENKRRYKTYN